MRDPSSLVEALVAPIAERHGAEVLEVQVRSGRGPGLVRVVVDAKGGVPLAVCQDISRELSARLDEEDPIPGRYSLEVSSPGVDRPLTTQRDFDRVQGRAVDVCIRLDGDAVTQVTGTVVAADEDAVRLAVGRGPAGRGGEEERRISYDRIVWAKQALPW